MKINILLFFLFCFQNGLAQNGGKGINYQAVIKDASSLPLGNKSVAVRFTLIKGTTAVYAESHITTSSSDGVINVTIGKGTAISGNFSSIDWTGEQVKVKVEMDKNGGSNFAEIGTTSLASVPYAYYAEKTNLNLIGKGVTVEGNKIIAKDSSATNELQNLQLTGNVLKISQGNEVTIPSGTLSLTQTEFDAIPKYKGLQVLNSTDRCLYIFDTPPYYYKYCGFGCNPQPDQANAGPDLLTNEQPIGLTGNIPSTGTGSWEIISGTGGLILNANNNTASFTGASLQSYVLRYIITNKCGTSTDDKNISIATPSVTDFEGNIYPIVTLGTQTWIIPNLRSTKYADGTDVTFFYPNNDPANKDSYGLLYTPTAAMKNTFVAGTQGVCPTGYHVPTQAELLTLFSYLESHTSEYTVFPPINAGQGNSGSMMGFNTFNMVLTSTIGGPVGNQNLYFYGFSIGSHTFFFTPLNGNEGRSVRCLKN